MSEWLDPYERPTQWRWCERCQRDVIALPDGSLHSHEDIYHKDSP